MKANVKKRRGVASAVVTLRMTTTLTIVANMTIVTSTPTH
jgi:hypothetical protein